MKIYVVHTMRYLFVFFIYVSSFNCIATIQKKDILIYNGEQYSLENYYLEEFFTNNPEKRPKNHIVSSNLWRGYVAIFTVIEKKIYLIDLQVKVRDKNSEESHATTWKSVFNEFSPMNDKFFIDWLDDLVLLPIGEVLDYKPGFGMTFNAYNFLEIKKGKIVNTTTISLDFYQKNFKKCHEFLRKKDLIALKEKLAN